MKTFHLLSLLLATILIVGPVFAKDTVNQERETEIALEAQSKTIEDAAEKAHREVERSLKTVEKQLRLAQNQTGQAMAAAGPALRRAFGASFVNTPEPPLVIATAKLDATALAELREDLNVMTKLVNDAVADEREEGPGRSAMGIIVKWLPGGGGNLNLYVQGAGAIIQTAVRFPLQPPQKADARPAGETPKNSAWESARRELYGGQSDADDEIVIPTERREEYNADRVDNVKKSILKALAHANNFRRLAADETVTVVVRNRNVSRSELVMFHSSEAHGRVQRSGAMDDSTLILRVKKSDADALAAGKLTEEEFQQRAQVAIY